MPDRSPPAQSATDAHLESIRKLIAEDRFFAERLRSFQAGDLLIRETEREQAVWLILEGELQLSKGAESNNQLRFDRLGAGELVGILSYYTRNPNYFGVLAVESGRALVLSWDDVDGLQESQPSAYRFLQELIKGSLTKRYQRLADLHIEVDRVNQALNQEREELRATIDELRKTRERLIHQEKLAMIGSIVPGIAHELNNPAASLSRNADYLEGILKNLLTGPDTPEQMAQSWQAGLQNAFSDTNEQRQRLEQLSQRFPKLPRPLLRRLAKLPPELIPQGNSVPKDEQGWERLLQPFEAGHFIQVVRSTSHRISRLVQSLKRYTRPQSENFQAIQVEDGIRDTLLVLGSRLRDTEIETDFAETPKVSANEDELNQVWTNLIVNAVEAMDPGGKIRISSRLVTDDQQVEISFSDSGPGVPESLRNAIFEPNFTTKAQGGNFGLGLGLSISTVILQKLDGTLQVEDNNPKGAKFIVRLPALRP
ncbi:MAG: cyclic nucleotide-binding domain-containing protein [Opitutales bacterium]|nr:cyclic nucleotide-binding domain-containing protein [Opitutales bacterium]